MIDSPHLLTKLTVINGNVTADIDAGITEVTVDILFTWLDEMKYMGCGHYPVMLFPETRKRNLTGAVIQNGKVTFSGIERGNNEVQK